MLLLSISIICLIISGILFILEKKVLSIWDLDFDFTKWVWGFIGLIMFGVSLFVTAITYFKQISSFEELKTNEKMIVILQDKKVDLVGQYNQILAKDYPKYEEKIFDKITPENVDMIFTKYPEIKTSLTLINLVDKIEKLNDDIYTKKIERENIKKDINIRHRNIYVYYFFIPKSE